MSLVVDDEISDKGKLWPAGGAKWKVRGSTEQLEIMFLASLTSVQHFMAKIKYLRHSSLDQSGGPPCQPIEIHTEFCCCWFRSFYWSTPPSFSFVITSLWFVGACVAWLGLGEGSRWGSEVRGYATVSVSAERPRGERHSCGSGFVCGVSLANSGDKMRILLSFRWVN